MAGMRLAAKSIDLELARALRARPFSGSVLSLHDDVIYLVPEGGRSLIVVAKSSVGNGPGYILVERPGSLKGLSAEMRPGVPFEACGRAVDIGEGSVRIEPAGAKPWDPALGSRMASPPERVAAAVRVVARTALESGRRTPLGALFDEAGVFQALPGEGSPSDGVRRRILAFAEALRLRREDAVRDATRALVGAGEGLTPSCDDMLVGFIGFLRGAGEGNRAIATWITGAIRGALVRTNSVSAHFLREAARGRFTERVKALIEAVFSGGEKRVEEAAAAMLEYGSTSGVDLIYGIVLGYNILGNRGLL